MLDLRSGVRLRSARHNARYREENVGWQRLEEINGLLEEIDNLFLRGVIDVAIGIERADASTVFTPLVLPEGLVIATLIFPIGFHIGEEGVGIVGLEDGANVCVLAGFVAVLVVSAIAVVRPVVLSVTRMIAKRGWPAYQSPWIVQELAGPVAGSVSQNCVCNSSPPG